MCTSSPEGQPYAGLNQEKCGQQVQGGDSAPLLCSGENPHRIIESFGLEGTPRGHLVQPP